MKVCFIQKQSFAYFGIMSIAGYLKKNGFVSTVLITNLENNLEESLRNSKADLFAISLLSSEHSWLEEITKQLKTSFPDTPIIVGGVHAILYPENVLKIKDVDYICIGEGEKTINALCKTLSDNKNDLNLLKNITGLGYKNSNSIQINEAEPLLQDFDFYEDRTIYYDRYPALKNDELKQFIVSRGCPYKCSFCFNKQISQTFKGQGKYIRRKKTEHVIKEIKQVQKTTVLKSIFFADDLFTLDKEWLREFLPIYKKKINVPFMCTTRAGHMDMEIAHLLKEAGCHTVSFGIESGNEHIRKDILNKNITDDEIINCAKCLKENNIRIQTANMFCLPDETIDNAFETIELNIKIKSDFIFATIFMPFPNTDLANYCTEKGYLKNDFNLLDLPSSFLTNSILKMKNKKKIENVQRCAYFLLRYPSLFPIFKKVIKNISFKWIFYPFLFLGTFLRYKEERKISFFGAIKFLWRFRKSF